MWYPGYGIRRDGSIRFFLKIGCVILVSVLTGLAAQTVKSDDPELQGIDIVEHLGDTLPLGTTFFDGRGNEVALDQFFHQGKPVLMTLAYYECPMLCTLVLNGVGKGIEKLAYQPGKDFTLLTVSIDTAETPKLAAANQEAYIKKYFPPGQSEGWHFFTGTGLHIRTLANSLGFKYYYDAERDQYAHPAAAYILTEDGVISRYLYGIDFKEQDLRLGLLEAAQGKIGSTIDRIILYCFHYDPDEKGYVVMASNVMRLGGAVTVILMAIGFGILWLREKRRQYANQED